MEKTEKLLSTVAKAEVVKQLREQVGVVDTFLEEARRVDKLSEDDLGNRFELFIGKNGSEITVKDRGFNAPVFSIRNRFLKVKNSAKVLSEISYCAFDSDRYPKTAAALAKVNWVESHSN